MARIAKLKWNTPWDDDTQRCENAPIRIERGYSGPERYYQAYLVSDDDRVGTLISGNYSVRDLKSDLQAEYEEQQRFAQMAKDSAIESVGGLAAWECFSPHVQNQILMGSAARIVLAQAEGGKYDRAQRLIRFALGNGPFTQQEG